jgi:hypothetical protein
VINIVAYILYIILVFSYAYQETYPSFNNGWLVFTLIYYTAVYLAITAGFLLYGRKLISLMPRVLQKKMIKVRI